MMKTVIYNNVPTPGCMQTPLSVATPDGGLLYTGFKCINYVSAPPAIEQEAAEVKTMSTRFTISALDVSPLWGKNDLKSKHFAIVAEDLSIQVWDCALGEAIIGHKAHQHQHEARDLRMYPLINVQMSYIANGNILSIDAVDLVIYCVASNTYCRRPTFLSPRNHQITVLRCSPYNENLFALGTAAGAVLICDLRKMCIVHKLTSSGQNARICNLEWRVMSSTVEEIPTDKPEKPINEQWRNTTPVAAKAPLLKSRVVEADDPFDIYNFDHLEGEFGAPASVRPRLISKCSDDCGDFVGLEKPSGTVTIDFIEACESVKAQLLAPADSPQVEVTLQDCQQTGTQGPRSDSSNKSEKGSGTLVSGSSEGSLEVIQFSSSSDDAVLVDGEAPKPKREVLHHIYHQAEVHDAPESPHLQAQTKPDPKPVEQLPVSESIDTSSIYSVESYARPDILLMAINANDIIMIWNTFTGANCAKNYSKVSGTGKSSEVHWLNDKSIVSLSRHHLSFWSLDFDPKSRRYKIQKDRRPKSGGQEIGTCAVKCATAEPQIWLCMRTREVGILNTDSGQLNAVYGCLAFGVRAIAECPDDMNKIALGCADKRVAIFDLSKLSSRCIPIDSVYLNSIVYSLAWSPDCLQLAFGTYDGMVGILDVERMRVRTTFPTVHKNEVYSLMWQDKYIYCIVNRVLAIYDATQPKQDAQILRSVNRASYLNVRGSFLFVGSEDGFLQLYERTDNNQKQLNYTIVRQTALLSRYITDIAFNPLESDKFVVVGHDRTLHVLEFQVQQRGWKELHKFTASDAKASITAVKWSNMQSNLLLSFHIEGKVCLWNTTQPEQPPLTITYHCPMWCGLFLPTDESVIMCSGKAVSLEMISVKAALAKNEKHICSKSDGLLRVKWASKSVTKANAPVLSVSQKKKQRRLKKVAAQPAQQEQDQEQQPAIESMLGALSLETKTSNAHAAPECNKCKQKELQAMPDNFLAHSRSCLCLTQKELNRSALEKLAIVLTEDAAKIDKAVLMSKLFSTKVMAKDLIATELTNLKHSNNKDIAPLCLAVSTFKVRDELQRHIDNKTLTEWHVSVAPSVSYVFWQKCCKAYAQQMEEQGYIIHAATYLSAIDMQTEAIDVLLKHEYFREALANARIHLPATDPVIKTIINSWLEQLERDGNFGAAALICVLDNEMLRGYSYLRKFRTCTPEIADLMEQIKRIGQLGPLFDDGCLDRAEAEENGCEKNAEVEAA